MDDIINTIIDIDRGASEKLSEAEKTRMKIITEAKALEERMISEAVEGSRRELSELEAKKEKETEEKKAVLEAERDAKIETMKKVFKKNSGKWCSEILDAVIKSG